jgi:hypothetical protein
LAILKTKIWHPKSKSPNVTLVVGLLDGALLDQQHSFFTITMENNKHPMPYICHLIVTLQLKSGHNWLQMSYSLKVVKVLEASGDYHCHGYRHYGR